MSENEDQKWARLQREREQNRPRNGGAIVREDAEDPRFLHPGNEGHDEERNRVRATKWAGQTVAGSAGPSQGASAQAPGTEAVPVASPEEPKPRGLLHNADHHLREHHTAGGEPRKHPRAPEETTPEPGVGRHREPGRLPDEPEIPPGARPIGAAVETGDARDRFQPAGTRRRPRDM